MFVSSTPQAHFPKAFWADFEAAHSGRSGRWRMRALVADDEGACYTAERRGRRTFKGQGVVVRYPNPFTQAGAPEILYATSEALAGIWRDGEGNLHAVGKRWYHTNRTGRWTRTEVIPQLKLVWGTGDEIWLAADGPGKQLGLVRIVDGVPSAIDCGLPGAVVDLAGSGPNDIYAASYGHGVAHFDGTGWRKVRGSPSNASLVAVSAREVFATGGPVMGRFSSDEVLLHHGNADDGFAPVRVDDTAFTHGFQSLTAALGRVFVGSLTLRRRPGELEPDDLVARLDGLTLTPVMKATHGFAQLTTGTLGVLWVVNGIEMLCFDGTRWKQMLRVGYSDEAPRPP